MDFETILKLLRLNITLLDFKSFLTQPKSDVITTGHFSLI